MAYGDFDFGLGERERRSGLGCAIGGVDGRPRRALRPLIGSGGGFAHADRAPSEDEGTSAARPRSVVAPGGGDGRACRITLRSFPLTAAHAAAAIARTP